MKRQIALVSLALALVGSACGQGTYINNNVVRVPPMDPALLVVDAETFINNNEFTAIVTNLTLNTQLWDSSNTRKFVNNGLMVGMPGFAFETRPSNTGKARPAESFLNEGNIVVDGGYASYYAFNAFFFSLGLPQLKISADNVTNRGEINLGFNSLGQIRGTNVNLSQGSIVMQDNGTNLLNQILFYSQGYWDGYWGLGTNTFSPSGYFESIPAFTPYHTVTNRSYLITSEQLASPAPLAYLDETIDAANSNRVVRAVFVGNTNANIMANVYFPTRGPILIELQSFGTNAMGTTTNTIYIEDTFGVQTNFQLFANGVSGANLTYQPGNYWIWPSWYGLFFGGVPASPMIIPAGTFGPSDGYQYTAYQALFYPASQLLSDVYGQNITNAAARIEISATNYLELNEATITSGSYLSLRATNHFGGSAGAQIASPFSDINLRVPNGQFTVTNLLVAKVPKHEGTVDLFSARWSNTVGGITNVYHILYADVQLSPTTPTRIQELKLVSTNTAGGDDNIIIHDVLNVTKTMLFDTERLTFATNDTDAATPYGGVNLLNMDVVWANSTPRLQYLTNQGGIQTFNSIFFGRGANTPYDVTDDKPYQVFVNSGAVTNYGSSIHAVDFVNSGVFHAYSGGITLQDTVNATMTNGIFNAQAGAIGIEAGTLLVSNHTFSAATSLALTITNSLDDGTAFVVTGAATAYPHPDNVTNKNSWVVGRQGLTLSKLPPRASLLATTISNYIATTVGTPKSAITWAGREAGKSTSGFTNNAALGRLILDGGPVGQFSFKNVVGETNALYVDSLELLNNATNRNLAGEFTKLSVDPNMRVYFGQAIANGVSVAEKLDGKAGGRFVWLSSFNEGHYSSSFVVYPDGSTNRLNTALVESCTLDSDGDGIVNCQDSSPVMVGGYSAGVAVLASGTDPLLISWSAPSYSTNRLYAADSLTSTNWQPLTNWLVGPGEISNRTTLILGPVGGRVTVSEPINAGQRYYRPRVDRQ